jgi:N-acyl-D-amino-acid deacylase
VRGATGLAPAGAALAGLALACGAPAPRAFVIANARVVDGTGAPAWTGAVRIEGDRIAAVGPEVPPARDTVDARGLVLAPGFIDTHSHADDGLDGHPDALAVASQGITTVVVGADGAHPYPLAEFFARLERAPPAVNVAAFAGHGTLRRLALGADAARAARADEVAAMARLLRAELAAGALGLSTGLEYEPGLHATTEEIAALARVAAEAGGRYATHIRSEDRGFWDAIAEALRVGRDAGIPVHLSHLKLAMRSLWGEADSLLRVLDAARAEGIEVSADVYPYTYWQSTLRVLFPERRFDDRAAAEFALREVVAPEGLRLVRFEPEPALAGLTLAEVARRRGTDAVTALLALAQEADAAQRARPDAEVESVIGTSMHEDDVARLLAWPHANLATDGELAGAHPRGYGAFTRFLGRYVRDRGLVPLEAAVRKMTALAAAHAGLRDRGTIATGAPADLVLFNPARVRDRATPDDPHALSEGIEAVWVNGVLVYRAGTTTGARPGRVLRRPDGARQKRRAPAGPLDAAGAPR